MYIVLLKFSNAKSQASEWMSAHAAWLQRGFDEGAFLLAGSLQPQLGGAIIALETSRAELDVRLHADPFVEHDVVRPEVFEWVPSKVDSRLSFLLA